jgi:hypothetical protein
VNPGDGTESPKKKNPVTYLYYCRNSLRNYANNGQKALPLDMANGLPSGASYGASSGGAGPPRKAGF